MKNYNHYASLVVASLLFAFVPGAYSAIIITATESGQNVVIVASGTIDTAALESFAEPGFTNPVGITSEYFNPSTATIILGGPATVSGEVYSAATVSGPISFGSGGSSSSSSSTGDSFGLDFLSVPGSALMWVPVSYTSNTLLNATMTFENQSFSSLGLTEGTYTWTWSSGLNVDSQTLHVIPEPSSALLLVLAMVFVNVYRRRN